MWDRISIRAVVIAFAAGLAVSFVLANVLLGMLAGDSLDPSMSDEATRAAIKTVAASPAFLLSWLVLGTGATVGSGWLAARLAKEFPLYNGLAVGIVTLVFDCFFLGDNPWWFEVIGLLLNVPASLYGANLVRRARLPKP
jgi:hypothetical protein